MRYFIDELIYDGKMIRCAGWAAPEDLGDPVEVTIRDEQDQLLPISVEKKPRPDVVAAMYGVQDRSEDYGFSFSFAPEDRIYAYINMQASHFALDRARKRLEIRDLETAYRKEHSFFGRMKKKKAQKRAQKELRKAAKKQ